MEGFYSETQAGAQDSVLIARIKKGDEEAFTIFYKRHFSKMYLAAVHLLKEEDMANDAVQELFMELWHRPERIDSTGNIKGYLYTVLRKALKKVLRLVLKKVLRLVLKKVSVKKLLPLH
ncbi:MULTISPECIES: RNA polymerase sigma factor [Sphingobacterium]|uniref:RNA polymerase sigma factor n=1 Tax=Sphingobacterium TaxID=28453 RepID=UPI000EDB3150|nr:MULTISPECIES: sigma factor [Sphingobacterium]HCX58250.1 hypothetical protein [Sphingobacterium sp.]